MEVGFDGEGDDVAVNPADILTLDQAHALIDAAESGFYRTFFTAAVYTGARVGELTGLTWNDIDLDAGTLRIRRSVSWARLKGEQREKPRL